MHPILTLGLMSGTSADGIDAALIRTDGEGVVVQCGGLTLPYPEDFRARLLAACRAQTIADDPELERDLTLRHAEAVRRLLADTGLRPQLIGFHGQTVFHAPERGVTCQIGDGPLLAELCGIDVVNDFRSADVAAGGQGAPLVPVYHRAVTGHLPRPLAVVNIGGVANVTWIGTDGELLACDTGPGNALIDDWVRAHTGHAFDADGALARSGQVNEGMLVRWLRHPYFALPAPKSLDRNSFYEEMRLAPRVVGDGADGGSVPPRPSGLGRELTRLSPADGAATLTALTARAIAAVAVFFPQPVRSWIVVGGGARNATLMDALCQAVPQPVRRGGEVGLNIDLLEAEAFAYLAVRSRRGLPLSFPGTTGVREAMPGGRFAAAPGAPSATDGAFDTGIQLRHGI